jgi:hypothetical protein
MPDCAPGCPFIEPRKNVKGTLIIPLDTKTHGVHDADQYPRQRRTGRRARTRQTPPSKRPSSCVAAKLNIGMGRKGFSHMLRTTARVRERAQASPWVACQQLAVPWQQVAGRLPRNQLRLILRISLR